MPSTRRSRGSGGCAVASRIALASGRVWWREALRLDTCSLRDWVLACIARGASGEVARGGDGVMPLPLATLMDAS